MQSGVREWGVLLLAWTLAAAPAASRGVAAPPLSEVVKKSYLEVLETARTTVWDAKEIEACGRTIEAEAESEKKRLEAEKKRDEAELKGLRRSLDLLNKRASRDGEGEVAERRDLHCRILKIENRIREAEVARKQGVPVALDNKRAKLALLQRWPAEARQIEQAIGAGRARSRRYGDVEDIGIRTIADGQEKDIRLGQDAINELKAYGLMPPEWQDPGLNGYVRHLADQLAVNSDLRVPLRVTVLESEEVNAFALPGGYLFINTGLIARTETESELVGVMAHELAHITARHSARLMKRATIAGIVYQAAQVAAMILTGGIVGLGTYYALQYGFMGLGLVLDLALLGVSREFEDEADQLGVQYAWKAGYDPRGFITLFDKLAMEKGYVTNASFFRTHPPFAERILATFRELAYLPEGGSPQVDSLRYQEAKRQMLGQMEERRREGGRRPTLKRFPDCEDEVRKPIASMRDWQRLTGFALAEGR